MPFTSTEAFRRRSHLSDRRYVPDLLPNPLSEVFIRDYLRALALLELDPERVPKGLNPTRLYEQMSVHAAPFFHTQGILEMDGLRPFFAEPTLRDDLIALEGCGLVRPVNRFQRYGRVQYSSRPVVTTENGLAWVGHELDDIRGVPFNQGVYYHLAVGHCLLPTSDPVLRSPDFRAVRALYNRLRRPLPRPHLSDLEGRL